LGGLGAVLADFGARKAIFAPRKSAVISKFPILASRVISFFGQKRLDYRNFLNNLP